MRTKLTDKQREAIRLVNVKARAWKYPANSDGLIVRTADYSDALSKVRYALPLVKLERYADHRRHEALKRHNKRFYED